MSKERDFRHERSFIDYDAERRRLLATLKVVSDEFRGLSNRPDVVEWQDDETVKIQVMSPGANELRVCIVSTDEGGANHEEILEYHFTLAKDTARMGGSGKEMADIPANHMGCRTIADSVGYVFDATWKTKDYE